MPTPIENGHVLGPLERVIKLGNNLSKNSDHIIVLNKIEGRYKLIITHTTRGTAETYDVGDKIPPDTGA